MNFFRKSLTGRFIFFSNAFPHSLRTLNSPCVFADLADLSLICHQSVKIVFTGDFAESRIYLEYTAAADEETGCGRPMLGRSTRRSGSGGENVRTRAAARRNSSLALITLGRLLSIMSGNRCLTQFRGGAFCLAG
jgi:hypothetical protein